MTAQPCLCGDELKACRFQRVEDPDSTSVFRVLSCSMCGLGKTDPIPSDLSAYYSPAYHGGRHSLTRGYCVQRRMGRVLAVSNTSHSRRLLDIGCGDGTFLLEAQRRGFDVVGTEINPLSARKAGLTVYGSMDEASANAPFDVITLWHSLEHLHDAGAVLSAARRALADRGVLLIAVPNARSWAALLFRQNWMHLDVPRHIWHFSTASLHGALAQHGFVVHRTWDHEIEYDVLGYAQSALNSVFKPRNEFYRWLTNKDSTAGRVTRALHALAGSLAVVGALPFIGIESLLGRGGTLVVAATGRDP